MIIFDTPPSLNYMTINALAAADELPISGCRLGLQRRRSPANLAGL